MKKILDACCGSKMCWFDKQREDVLFMDNRKIKVKLNDGRPLNIEPDIIADFRKMPFLDESFYLVVFDPPHLLRAGENSWLRMKYGVLEKDTWKLDIQNGFKECFRVLKKNGILVFKWSEGQIKLSEILKCTETKPLFGNKRGKTHWIVFIKD